jgi:hypothetical protein
MKALSKSQWWTVAWNAQLMDKRIELVLTGDMHPRHTRGAITGAVLLGVALGFIIIVATGLALLADWSNAWGGDDSVLAPLIGGVVLIGLLVGVVLLRSRQ